MNSIHRNLVCGLLIFGSLACNSILLGGENTKTLAQALSEAAPVGLARIDKILDGGSWVYVFICEGKAGIRIVPKNGFIETKDVVVSIDYDYKASGRFSSDQDWVFERGSHAPEALVSSLKKCADNSEPSDLRRDRILNLISILQGIPITTPVEKLKSGGWEEYPVKTLNQ
jgi:hypothetical protein